MAIIFEPSTHSYKSIDVTGLLSEDELTPEMLASIKASNEIDWISVTTLVSYFKQPFEPKSVAAKSAKNKKSKWYGMDVSKIVEIWNAESKRSCNLGDFYHKQRESDLLSVFTINKNGKDLVVIPPMYDEIGRKIASTQKLEDGIYPEHMVYLKSLGICGQSDLVEVIDGVVHITDYKTNKEIKKESYKNWEGKSQRMNAPLTHLDDCNLNHYNIQLSLYMYIILKHNPNLKPGTLKIHHVLFEEEDRKDEFGFPVHKLDSNGDPIVDSIEVIELPYLRDEIISITHWLKDNKHKLKTKK